MTEIDLADAILRHSLDILRLSAHEQAEVVRVLETLERELTTLLRTTRLSDAGKQQVKALIAEAGKIIEASYSEAAKLLDTRALAGIVAEQTAAAIAEIVPGASATFPTAETLQSLSNDVLIEGSPASKWWDRQAEDTAFRFGGAVRQGVVNGETNEQIVARITGKNGEPGIMDVSRRNARTLVQSSVQAAANYARLATFRRNSEHIMGVRQLSTLDSHTSPICIAYSGSAWDLDGEPILGTILPFNGGPPRHMNCRSILTPIPKSLDDIFPGLDERIAAQSQRASSLGPVGGNITFEEFLKRQPDAFADRVLGKGRAALWRAGKITLRDLVSGTGRPLTLEQLRNL